MRSTITALCLGLACILNAQVWHDPTFCGDGIYDVSQSEGHDKIEKVLIQPDGKIILVGYVTPNGGTLDLYLARMNEDGTFDSSFGTNGIVTYDQWNQDNPADAALTADGKIVVAIDVVSTGNPFGQRILRFTSTGQLDTSFDGDGQAIVDPDEDFSSPGAIAVHADGRIVVAGRSSASLIVSRILENGAPDTGFGVNGSSILALANQQDYSNDLVITSDGRYRVAVSANNVNNEPVRPGVVGYTSTGALDTDFGNGGAVWLDWGNDAGHALALIEDPSDGTLLVAAYGTDTATALITRLSADGSVDATFGVNGQLGVSDGAYAVNLRQLAIDSEGRILAVGRSYVWSDDYHAILCRVLPDGTFDASFGTDGRLAYAGPDDRAEAHSAALDAQGRIVVVGAQRTVTGFTQPNDVLAMRYLPAAFDGIPEADLQPLPLVWDGDRLGLMEPLDRQATLRVIDAQGRTVFRSVLSTRGEASWIPLPEQLAVGGYSVLLEGKDLRRTGRFIVAR